MKERTKNILKFFKYFFIKKFLLCSFLTIFLSISLSPLLSSSNHPASRDLNSDPDYQAIIAAYESFVDQQMRRDHVPGLSVAFRHKDFFWARGFGYADLENDIPAKPESSYRLASITKTITALAILLLYEEGKIDLDDEVQKYVPAFPRKPWPITIRQLLGHLGGISHYRNYDVEGRIRESKTTAEALAIFKDFALVAEPGTRYNYSTYGYNLLGAVVEAASGLPYGEFIRQRIFEPLGLTSSRLDSPTDLIPNRVRGYRLLAGEVRPSEFIDISSRFAGGGARSTVVDLIRYGYNLLIEGKLLRPDTRRLMLTSMAQKNGLFTGYGMGWVISPWNGHFQVNHGGSQQETRTHLAIFPEEKLVIAVACNLEGTNLITYTRQLAELIFKEKLDLNAYPPSLDSAFIWKGCEQAFNYGLSQYYWNKGPLTSSSSDLEASFKAFNSYLNPKAVAKNRNLARNFILTGIHPAGRQYLTKMGVFMALVLSQNKPELLKSYHEKGPAIFFLDYIRLSEDKKQNPSLPRFDKEIKQLIEIWSQDWPRTFTPAWLNLTFDKSVDWFELTQRLKTDFSGKTIFPDFSANYIHAAQEALNNQKYQEALRIINLGLEVYPLSPNLQAAYGVVCFWTENISKGQQALELAFSLDPFRQSISTERFLTWSSQFQRAKKIKEALAIIETGLKFHPQEARLYYDYARLNLLTKNQVKAIQALEKALAVDPNFDDARLELEKIRKR